MKKFFWLIFTLVALTGCKSTYDVTMSNGTKVQNVSKPVLDSSGRYKFKMPDGKEVQVSSSRVRTIEPRGESSDPQFVSPTPKKK